MTLLFLAIGLAAGVLSGLFGLGGGIIIVPALIYLAGFTPQQASGASLGALLLPVGALGAWTYYKAGALNWEASLIIAGGLFVGAYFGAQITQHIDGDTLRKGFAVLMAVMAVKLWVG